MGVHRHFLLVVTFLSGLILMALEMIGFRVLAPYFGNSVYVWGNLIGVVLIAMSFGYLVGGKLADLRRSEKDLYVILSASALYILAVVFVYSDVLQWLSQFGDLWGSFWAGTFLFAVPIFLLSFVTPYIIALIAHQKDIGFSVGIVNFVGTIGNVLGIYGAIFFFIPYLGIRVSFIVCFAVLLLLALVGFFFVSKKWLILAAAFLIIFFVPAHGLEGNLIYESESFYNHIEVYDVDGNTYLILNSDRAIQSVNFGSQNFTGSYFDFFLFMPELSSTDEVLVLGMGAGSTLNIVQEYYPNVSIDAVELDGKVVEVAQRFFGVERSEQLNIFVDDGRMFLKNSDTQYGVVAVDIFQGSLHIPFYVLTQEFFQQVSDHIVDDGYMMMNVYVPEGHDELLWYIQNTIVSVFADVYAIENGDNNMVIASKQPKTKDEILALLDSDYDRVNALVDAYPMRKIVANDKVGILTDNLAPVEQYMRDY